MTLRTYSADSPVAALVLGHGAGAGQASPFMVWMATALAERGISTGTFDFPYMAAGRKLPDRAPVLESAWRDAIDAARTEWPSRPLFIGGKSLGGRMASHVAAAGGADRLAGVVLLGYPLHPPGKPQQRRDAHLSKIAEPMLFVQGTRDAFGTADEIRSLLPSLQRAALHEVRGGDHSFAVLKRDGDRDPVLRSVADGIVAWIMTSAIGDR